jgi:hypothetical protein
MFDVQSNYFSGQGILLLGDRNTTTGKGSNFINVGNVSDLKIAVATTTLEHKESSTGSRGIDLRLTTEIKSTLSMVMESFNPVNLAMALRGQNISKAGASVTAEAHVFTNSMISTLAHIGVSAVVVKKAAAVLVAYTTGMADGAWDYKLNAQAGSIQWAKTPNTALLIATDALTVDYAYAAQNVVGALTEAAGEKFLRFEGLNTADGNKPVIVEVFRLASDPLKELALISATVQQYTLDGTILYDAVNTDSHYFRQTMLA